MKLTKYLLSLALMVSATSCLDEDPLYSLNSESTFEDIRTAQLALKGCFGYMTTYDSFGQAGQELLTGASGLGWTRTNAGDQDRFASLDATPACVITKMFWNGMYKTISECCFFIHNMERSTVLAESERLPLIAQAKFLRGVAYYQLVTTFGGVPLRNDAPTAETLSLPRATEAEIYAQIERDFKEALPYIEEDADKGYGSRAAAYAYLAKLYWTQASQENTPSSAYWKQAQLYCDSVFQTNAFKLESKFSTLFENYYQGDESIFQLNFSTASSTTGNRGNWLFAPSSSTAKGISWGRVRSSKAFHDLFKGTYPTDPRYAVTFMSEYTNTSSGDAGYTYPTVSYKSGRKTVIETIDYTKLADPTNPTLDELTETQLSRFTAATGEGGGWPYFRKSYDYNSEAQNCNKNVMLYRYADFLLIAADVENELGNRAKAVGYLNQVLDRARLSGDGTATDPADVSTSISQDDLRRKIFYERLFELAGEPTMYSDVRHRGVDYLREICERHNNHHVTQAFATNTAVTGIHNFRDRVYNDLVITDEFLKKNLLLPIPQEELNTNDMITVNDQNYGY
jgi:hypothetical protein